MGLGVHAQNVPFYFQFLRDLFEEAVRMEVVKVDRLDLVTAKKIYKEYTSALPTPKIMDKYQLPWNIVFKRLWDTVLEPPVQSLMFLMIHNVLPIRTRLLRLNMVNTDKCKEDGLLEDVEHVFCHCVRTRDGWQWIRWKITNDLIPLNFPIPSDFELLNLCFESPHDKEIIWLVGSFVHLTWEILQTSAGHIDVDRMKIHLQLLYKMNQTGQNKIGTMTW